MRTLVVPLLLLGALSGCGSPLSRSAEISTRPPLMSVTVEAVREIDLHQELPLMGTVEAWQALTISSELSGLAITRLAAGPNDKVRSGDPLVYLDDRALQTQLQAAEARHRRASSAVELSRRPERAEQVRSLQARVEEARAFVGQEQANLAQEKVAQANAARVAERYEHALREGVVTALEAERGVSDRDVRSALVLAAERRVEAAKFALKRAQEELRAGQVGGRIEEVAIAVAERDEAAAAVASLRLQIEQCVVRAPDDGLVLSQNAYLGDTVSLGQELFVMARQSRLQLWADVPQHQLPLISPGSVVRLSHEGSRETGVIEKVDSRIDPETRQGRVRITLEPTTAFRVGGFAKANLKTPSSRVLAVPAAAVQGQHQDQFVFVLENGRAIRKSVHLGSRDGDLVEVQSGLDRGDRVIVSGAAFLADGELVEVVDS